MSSPYNTDPPEHTVEELEQTVEELRAALEACKAESRQAEHQIVSAELIRGETDKYIYGLTHDLRTPLRSVVSFTQLMARRLPADSDVREYIDLVLASANEMNSIIEGVQVLSKLSKPNLVRTTIRLDVLLQLALLQLQSQIKEAGAQVTYVKLPEVTVADGQFVMLFEQLLSNSLRYRSTNTPQIDILCEEGEEVVTVSVRDNGEGIAAEYQKKVFEPFQRLHGRERSGPGLGLTICRKIVEGHGGKIWLESDGETGSAFRFTVPVQ